MMSITIFIAISKFMGEYLTQEAKYSVMSYLPNLHIQTLCTFVLLLANTSDFYTTLRHVVPHVRLMLVYTPIVYVSHLHQMLGQWEKKISVLYLLDSSRI